MSSVPVATSQRPPEVPVTNPQTTPQKPAAVPTATTAVQKFEPIAIAQIEPSANNPRKSFPAESMAELVASVKAQGVIEPIVVRTTWTKLGAAKPQYEIVCGERRWRAAKAAGLSTVPAIIRELTDLEAREIQVTENDQREDVTALEQARGYASLADSIRKDKPALRKEDIVKQIALKIGRSERYVYARLKLATDLAPEVAKALEAGEITASHADELVRLAPPVQKQALKLAQQTKWVQGPGANDGNEQITVPVPIREFKAGLAREFRTELSTATWNLDDAALLVKAGACTVCPRNSANDPTSDEKKPTCLDRQCFKAKRKAFVDLAIAKATEEAGGVPAKALAGEYFGSPEGSVPEWQWSRNKVKKGSCPKARPGAVVNGKEAGKVYWVCLDDTCTVHHADSAKRAAQEKKQAAAKSYPKAKEKAEQQEKCNEAVERAIFRAATAGVPDAAALRWIIAEVIDLFGGDCEEASERAIADTFGWPCPEGPLAYDFLPAACKKHGEKLKAPELLRLLLAIVLAHSYQLEVQAKKLGVDVATVRGSAVAEFKRQADVAKKQACTKCGCTPQHRCSLGGKKTCALGTDGVCSGPDCTKKPKAAKPVKKAAKKGGRK